MIPLILLSSWNLFIKSLPPETFFLEGLFLILPRYFEHSVKPLFISWESIFEVKYNYPNGTAPGDVQNINDTTCNFDFVFVMSDKPKRKTLKSRTTDIVHSEKTQKYRYKPKLFSGKS